LAPATDQTGAVARQPEGKLMRIVKRVLVILLAVFKPAAAEAEQQPGSGA